MTTLSSLPLSLFTLPAGAVADLIDRRKMLYEVNPWRPTVPMHGLHRFGQDQRQQRSERRAEGERFASHLILKPACIQSTWAGNYALHDSTPARHLQSQKQVVLRVSRTGTGGADNLFAAIHLRPRTAASNPGYVIPDCTVFDLDF